jgi:tetratricopeptide (TPR) repeat protein
MKNLLFLIAILGITTPSIAQQTFLKGVVTVQNSKTNTGQTQYVKNAKISHPNAKNDVTTDDEGKFMLDITGLKQNIQTKIDVILHGAYGEYVVVNEKELQNITIGRETPVSVYICKKDELEQRQAEMVSVNMQKLEERTDANKKRLQKELEDLKSKNDYLNVRYGEIKDSLDVISKNIDKTFERIKEYARIMALENLDDRDENYVKAYGCFSRGELDSVFYYLQEEELELKHQKILQLQKESKKEKELSEILTESAKIKVEYTNKSLNRLMKEWLLQARIYSMKNDYEKTIFYYEKMIEADPLNVLWILMEDFDELEEADAIPEERKEDVEKIRKMFKD